MRFTIAFKPDGNDKPYLDIDITSYRRYFMRFIKNNFSEENLKRLYEKRLPKPFTFSVFFPDMVVTEDKIRIPVDKNILFNFSTFDSDLGQDLIHNIFSGPQRSELFIGKNKFQIIGLSFDEERKINSKKFNSVFFRTLSPVLIPDGYWKPRYMIPIVDDLEKFNACFSDVHDKKFTAFRGYGLKEPLRLIPADVKKCVVKHFLREFSKVEMFTGFTGLIEIIGDPEDLDMLYKTGLGVRTGQGFGMVI